jgi:branched-chain amino acid transport system permease protein
MVNEMAIVALFALSLDLVLGYAGIVSLGHAAFLGFGAYSAALFAKHIMPDPLVGLCFASLISGGEIADADYEKEYYDVSVALVVIWCAVVFLCEVHRSCRWYSAPSQSGWQQQQEMVVYSTGQDNKT